MTRRGFSLIELVVAMAVSAFVVIAATSAVVISSHAIPDNNEGDGVAGSWESGRAMNRILGELRYAQYITHRERYVLGFTVPDRNGDGTSERIRYEWSGTAGDPLVRYQNGSAGVTVVESIDQLSFEFDLTSTTETFAGIGGGEATQIVVASQENIDGDLPFSVTGSNDCGQYFMPTLPGDATSWDLDKIEFRARDWDLFNSVNVKIFAADENLKPTGEPLWQFPYGAAFNSGSFDWKSMWPMLKDLAPNQGMCMVLERNWGDPAMAIQYTTTAAAGMLETNDDGASWTHHGDKAICFRVCGTPYISPADHMIVRQFVERSDVSFTPSGAAVISSATQMLNTPELLSAYWELHFNEDPLLMDTNGDAEMDWQITGAGVFNTSDITDGVWDPIADLSLETSPANDFTEVTTVDLRARSQSTDTAGFMINADRSGGTQARLEVMLDQNGANERVRLYHYTDNTTRGELTSVDVPISTFAEVTLRIVPTADVVNLMVNGVDQGTFAYDLFPTGTDGRVARAYAYANAVEWDYVRIRVGGRSNTVSPTTPNAENEPPLALADVSPKSVLSGQNVTFDATGSVDPDSDPLTAHWMLEGDVAIEGDIIEHAFTKPGRYDVTLIVTDGAGGYDDDSVTVIVRGGG